MTNDEIMNLDLSKYKGKKYKRFDNGALVESYDSRELDYEKAKKIKKFMSLCSQDITKRYPVEMQINALYQQINSSAKRMHPKKVNELNSYIDNCIDKYEQKLSLIFACKTCDELDNIQWN